MKKRGILPALASLAVFILLEAASLWILQHNAPLQRTWLAQGGQAFMGAIWGSTEKVKQYFFLSESNRKLAQENFLLARELENAREQLRQHKADSARTRPTQGFSLVPAEVVKMSRGKQHNYLILNRGYEDGIQEKSGVVTPRGVVGIVDAVSAHHSYAFSFCNSDISISARLGEEGGSGLLVWDGRSSGGAILKEIPLQYKYEKGDTVFTSGHSLMFPPDIPLGVAGESRVVNGSTNEISVRLFQDFSTIRYVTVVHNKSFDEIEEFDL